MTKAPATQSQKRFEESVGALFVSGDGGGEPVLFLKSSTDTGVVRNGGRNGARFAPQSFLSTFRRFTLTRELRRYRMVEAEVGDPVEERRDFGEAQRREARRIADLLAREGYPRFCHLGGGHDHVYPLLLALGERFERIVVINVDAHADTRTDDEAHSGTPFRQFAAAFADRFHLFQIGLHPFANSLSTLAPLPGGEGRILWASELGTPKLDELFRDVRTLVDDKTAVVFSLDADALQCALVPGVSAVNPGGLSLRDLEDVWERYRALPLSHHPFMGIYELNPVYDTLASVSMRTLSSFVFRTL
jgi:formiminoglutamase